MEITYKDIKFGAYHRKSSTDDGNQVLSIESQERVNKETATKFDLNIFKSYVDRQTAYKPYKRSGFDQMMKDLNDGVIDGILCWRADRLARNPIEGGSVLYSLQTGLAKIIQTQSGRYLPADNTLPLTLELGMASQQSIDLSKNVKVGNKTKTLNGGHCGVAPHGYLNDVINKTVYPDSDRFHLVRKMWDLMLTGAYSVPEIAKIANEEWGFKTYRRKKSGGAPLPKSTLHNMFINPFYYGWVRKGENQNWGSHKPMITQAEFETVQTILRRTGRKAVATYDFPFTGSILCGECGCSITAEEKVKYRCPSCDSQHSRKSPSCCSCGHQINAEDIGKGTWYIYYHCTKKKGKCAQGSVDATELEKQIDQKLSTVDLDPDFEGWSLKWLKALNKEQTSFKETEYKRFQREYESAEQKLNNLIDMRANGELTKDEFMAIKENSQKTRDEAKQRLSEVDLDGDGWLKKAGEEMDFVIGIRKKFKDGSKKEKRYIFNKTGSNFTLKDGNLYLEAKNLYVAFKDLESVMDLRFEPPEMASLSTLNDIPNHPYPIWLPRLDSNQRPSD